MNTDTENTIVIDSVIDAPITPDMPIVQYDENVIEAKYIQAQDEKLLQSQNVVITDNNHGKSWRVARLTPNRRSEIAANIVGNANTAYGQLISHDDLLQVYVGDYRFTRKNQVVSVRQFVLAIIRTKYGDKAYMLTNSGALPRGNAQDDNAVELAKTKIRAMKALAESNGTYSATQFHNNTPVSKTRVKPTRELFTHDESIDMSESDLS